MDQAADPEECRAKANLLLARLGEVVRGVTQVTLKGFQGEEIVLPLDPSLSPHENAEALYAEAARRERARQRLPPLLEKAKGRLEEITDLRASFSDGRLTEEEVEARLPGEAGKKRWRGTGQAPRLPFKRFRSSGGLEIRVGRGSGDNDALTFRHSHPEDVWLHARDTSGAHVILKWVGRDTPPERDLTEAAILAALHSSARNARVVPVDWTRRKHVRKLRKAPPGTVTTQQTKTLFVQPDPHLPERLMWED
jgi:predicted ribosome quality control (RQC) complex YloA/Tae2 family protein